MIYNTLLLKGDKGNQLTPDILVKKIIHYYSYKRDIIYTISYIKDNKNRTYTFSQT